jgi:hypothetical protein
MSRCRTSCVSSARVFVGKTIDLFAPWLAAMVPLAYGAMLLLAPSGHGALAYDELVATRVVATPIMPNPAYLQPVTDPVFGTNFTQNFESGPYKRNPSNDGNRRVARATWSSNWGQVGGPVADYVARVLWPGTAARK